MYLLQRAIESNFPTQGLLREDVRGKYNILGRKVTDPVITVLFSAIFTLIELGICVCCGWQGDVAKKTDEHDRAKESVWKWTTELLKSKGVQIPAKENQETHNPVESKKEAE